MSASRWFILITLCLVAHGAASAQSPQLPVVGHLPLEGGGASIAVHGSFVYLGGHLPAGQPLRIVSIADPARPRVVASLPGRSDTVYGKAYVEAIDTPAFKGDLLGVGLSSVEANGTDAIEFWDVTDPRQPKRLSSLPRRATVHDLIQREGRVLVFMTSASADLEILDATDPTRPALLASWRLPAELRAIRLGVTYSFSAGVAVSTNAAGTRAYLSCVDAGTVILDITDPGQPRFLGRTSYGPEEEGNAYYADDGANGRLLATADLDGDPTPAGTAIRVIAPARIAGYRHGIETEFTRQLAAAGPVRGEVVDVGAVLPDKKLTADPRGKIALVDLGRSRPTPSAVARRLEAAGAVAVLYSEPIAGHLWTDRSRVASVSGIPGMGLDPGAAAVLRAAGSDHSWSTRGVPISTW